MILSTQKPFDKLRPSARPELVEGFLSAQNHTNQKVILKCQRDLVTYWCTKPDVTPDANPTNVWGNLQGFIRIE